MRLTILYSVALGWSALCLASMLIATGGHLSMPLDDAYIFFQYARRVVEGGFFTYQDGGSLNTGATSPLTVIVHSLGYLIGFRGAAMSIFALLLGGATLGWSACSAFTIGKRLCSQVPWLPAALLLVSGPLIWGFMSGMDLPIFVALSLAVIAAWPEPGNGPRPVFFFWAGLLGLTRPDALFLLIPLFILGWRLPVQKRWWTVPLAGVALPFLVQTLLTGSPQSASLDAKSVLSDPGFTMEHWLLAGVSYLQLAIKGVFGGGVVQETNHVLANNSSGMGFYMVPFSLALTVIGLFPGAWVEARSKRPGVHLLIVTWMILLLAAVSFAVPREWHWHRYLMPIYGLVILGIASGVTRAGHWIDLAWPELPGKNGATALGVALLLLSLPGAVFFTVAYGRNSADIYYQHIELADRFSNSRPVQPRILGLHDAGALAYFGGYRILDLEGLVSESFRGPGRLEGAGVWEALERMPGSERPDVLALHPNWFDAVFTRPHRLVHSQRLFRPSIVAGNPLNVYLANWSLAGKGDQPRDPAVVEAVEELTLMIEVDIADLDSEKKAGFGFKIFDGAYENVLHLGEIYPGQEVMDGGRLISGWEEFRVPDTRPGDSLVLVGRSNGPFRLNVEVNGLPAGKWIQNEGGPGRWAETSFAIPEAVVTTREVILRISSGDPHHSAYGSFHYWVYRR